MSGDPPDAAGQVCPRSVLLSPDRLLVPASTLRALLRGGRRLPLVSRGFGLEPALRDGAEILVEGGRRPRRGDLLLCEHAGWGDLRRARRPLPGGAWQVALDAFPRRAARVPAEAVLGVVVQPRSGRAGRRLGRLSSGLGLGAAWFAWRRIERAPAFGDRADASVLAKYRGQVAVYRRNLNSNLDDELLAALRRFVRPGDRVLIAGCGAGGEALHLARQGYAVTAFDALPEMVEAAQDAASEAGLAVELFQADLHTVDPGGRPFGAIYMTPLLYSFIAGRRRREAVLRRLASRLDAGGCLLLSVRLSRSAGERLQTLASWARHRIRGRSGVERGDWYTWFPAPDGSIAYAFQHRFTVREVRREIRRAGFGEVRRRGVDFLASRPRVP